MSFRNLAAQARAGREGVVHATFNPEGPGAVRIHLIPPRFRLFFRRGWVVILNGYYILPLGYSWAVLLSGFLKELNRFDGKPLDEETVRGVADAAVRSAAKVFPSEPEAELRADLGEMLGVLFDVAKEHAEGAGIEALSIRKYARNMTGPHRMDLLVSAMSDEHGAWKCNQRCKFCYAAEEARAKVRELSTQEWKTVIDRCRAAGIPMLTFTGGEPTLRGDLAELVSYAKWFVTRLNTNGVLLTRELCGALRAASLDSVQVTLYSSIPEIHDELVGAAHFTDTVRGLKNALAAGLDVSVNTPLCRLNADYAQTLALLRELGVRYVSCSGLICTGRAQEGHAAYDLGREALGAAVREAAAYCAANGMELSFTSPGLLDEALLRECGLTVPYCGAALSNMAVAPDGTVVPCQSWLSADASLGNILTDKWKKIWNGRLCREIRGMDEAEATSCPFRRRGNDAGDH